jgi:hypothetical protein
MRASATSSSAFASSGTTSIRAPYRLAGTPRCRPSPPRCTPPGWATTPRFVAHAGRREVELRLERELRRAALEPPESRDAAIKAVLLEPGDIVRIDGVPHRVLASSITVDDVWGLLDVTVRIGPSWFAVGASPRRAVRAFYTTPTPLPGSVEPFRVWTGYKRT